MSIWDRLTRAARAELSEMKRVLSDKDGPGSDDPARPQTPEEARWRAIREAEEELARAEKGVAVAQLEMGAHGWEQDGRPLGPTTSADPELDRGASIWARAGAEPAPTTHATTAATGPVVAAGWQNMDVQPKPEAVQTAPARAEAPRVEAIKTAPAKAERTHEIPRDVREAYAALELALGAGADAVHRNHATLVERFHPERFGTDAERQRIAELVKGRIDAARDIVLAWLASA